MVATRGFIIGIPSTFCDQKTMKSAKIIGQRGYGVYKYMGLIIKGTFSRVPR